MHNTRRIRATLLIKVSVGSSDCSPWAKPFLPRVGGPVSLAIVPWGREKKLKKSPVDPCTMLIVHIPPSWWQTVVEFTCLSLAEKIVRGACSLIRSFGRPDTSE